MRTQWLVQALLAATLAACQATGPPQPVKSPIDDREYRHVVLPNHLHALLIHAPRERPRRCRGQRGPRERPRPRRP